LQPKLGRFATPELLSPVLIGKMQVTDSSTYGLQGEPPKIAFRTTQQHTSEERKQTQLKTQRHLQLH
jgi:hypothetical protein